MVNVAELELSRSAIAGLSQESRTHLPSRVRSATANLSETGSGVIDPWLSEGLCSKSQWKWFWKKSMESFSNI